MRLFIVGLWAVLVTIGAGAAVSWWAVQAEADEPRPTLEGLRYTSLPTMSVPTLEGGRVSGYLVVRMVYTADAAVLRALASEPDPFITDEVFRSLYGRVETRFGALQRLDLEEIAREARDAVNARLGDAVIDDLLVDGLNYVDLSTPQAAAKAAEFTRAVSGAATPTPQP